MTPDFFFGVTEGDVVYDIETYPNTFTLIATHTVTEHTWLFEISDRTNDVAMLRRFMDTLRTHNCRMVGFNNLGFDYPVLHAIYSYHHITVTDIYNKAMDIIKSGNKFAHMIWDNDQVVPQIDLYKIHHFDNKARATSLKVLEFNMRMDNIEDLPFPVGAMLTDEQKDILIEYNHHDVKATLDFYHESKDQIRFREELTERYGKNFLNFSDSKIGSEIFIQRLEETNPGCCYQYVNGKRTIRQTPRESIKLSECIPTYIDFENDEFKRIHQWLSKQTITETKGVFKDLHCHVGGINYHFGTGGLHASVEWQSFTATEGRRIQVRDVASMYPNIAIKNKYYPEHLGETFCLIYEDMYNERKVHKKAGNDAEQAMLKLALNGTYGNSNNEYSPFYDPKFTMSVTLTGQLSLALLCEKLIKTPNLQIIFANTDGVCYICDEWEIPYVDAVCSWWEQLTQLELETDEVSRIWMRDCNSYIQEYAE